MSNVICIDPSLSCTAVVVNDRKAIFTTTDNAMGKKQRKLTKWFEACSPHLEIFCHDFEARSKIFSTSELSKFVKYSEIADSIVEFIGANTASGPSEIYIEGYSFSSAAGPLIDLVTFGTILRSKIYTSISTNINVIPPSELKKRAAMLTYLPVKEGSKSVHRNNEGVAGGSFKKKEMYKALIENANLDCEWVELLREHAPEILSRASIPKPIEDINDAKLMYEIVMSDK